MSWPNPPAFEQYLAFVDLIGCVELLLQRCHMLRRSVYRSCKWPNQLKDLQAATEDFIQHYDKALGAGLRTSQDGSSRAKDLLRCCRGRNPVFCSQLFTHPARHSYEYRILGWSGRSTASNFIPTVLLTTSVCISIVAPFTTPRSRASPASPFASFWVLTCGMTHSSSSRRLLSISLSCRRFLPRPPPRYTRSSPTSCIFSLTTPSPVVVKCDADAGEKSSLLRSTPVL